MIFIIISTYNVQKINKIKQNVLRLLLFITGKNNCAFQSKKLKKTIFIYINTQTKSAHTHKILLTI